MPRSHPAAGFATVAGLALPTTVAPLASLTGRVAAPAPAAKRRWGWRRAPPPSPEPPSLASLATHRPLALLAVVPRPAVLFAAGALAGALGKTATAPLDRVKLLMQTGGGLETGAVAAAARQGKLFGALAAVGRDGGAKALWRGNVPQLLKVVPYSAAQLTAYDALKKALAGEDGALAVRSRLAAGALAGALATLATHPLDTLRLRMAVDPAATTVAKGVAALAKEGGAKAFYRGLAASVAGIAPYMALELACFDLLPPAAPAFARGAGAALIATTACYPLDTLKRRVQLRAAGGASLAATAAALVAADGVKALYRGFLPNCLKNLPNKGVKMSVFDGAKRALRGAEAALAEETEANAARQRRARK
jgi:solute carrier family 25 phosphate transporter 23/24/25/41